MSLKNERKIDSIDMLRAAIYHVFKTEKDWAEMYDVFISGESANRFWIYELLDESDGTKRMMIDYSLNDGGGWLNLGRYVNEFNEDIEKILLWPMTEEVSSEVRHELFLLNQRAEKNKIPSV